MLLGELLSDSLINAEANKKFLKEEMHFHVFVYFAPLCNLSLILLACQ